MNVLEMIGQTPTRGDVGVEIEVEGMGLPGAGQPTTRKFDTMWRVDQDGSLRGESVEYVMRSPKSLAGVKIHLDELAAAYQRCKTIVADSVRAGVHVHINCQKLTMTQVMTFATLYYVVEELMLLFCNTSRRGNHFCLRAKDAEYQIFHVINVLQSKAIRDFGDDNTRYSSINFCALTKFGSLEFRSLEGTEDLDKIHLWASILLNLRKVSLTYPNPVEVIQSMSQDGYENFLRRVFGEFYEHFSGMENIDGHLLVGTRQAQDLAYGIDWHDMDDGWGPRARRPRLPRRDVDEDGNPIEEN